MSMNHDEMIAVIQAHKEGKKIQFNGNSINPSWVDYLGFHHGLNFATYDFRIKPEPKLRPWKPEEVPVGAVVRCGATQIRYLIVFSFDGRVRVVDRQGPHDYPCNHLVNGYQWKWPHEPESAWRQCGVTES